MNNISRPVLVALLIVLYAATAQAAWYKLGKINFPERRTITITNNADAPADGVPVRIALTDLKVTDDARGTAVVVDPDAQPTRDGEGVARFRLRARLSPVCVFGPRGGHR